MFVFYKKFYVMDRFEFLIVYIKYCVNYKIVYEINCV